ncbi:MAG: hypothetical protein NC078_11750, partial [Ruminococcus sp.]|nr:hypothetical protein [Ruminococcus sp.]
MPGKIYDLSDLDNLELPPLPAQKAKQEEAGKQTAATLSATPPVQSAAPADPLAAGGNVSAGADDFELPPLPVKKAAKAGDDTGDGGVG